MFLEYHIFLVLQIPLCFHVTTANISDVHPTKKFVDQLLEQPRLEKVLADKAYQGIPGDHDSFTVEITAKKDQKGFVLLHKRWVVERTFAWMNRQRRLFRDYENDSENDSENQRSIIFIGMTKIMLNKLA
jgi:putative transposase